MPVHSKHLVRRPESESSKESLNAGHLHYSQYFPHLIQVFGLREDEDYGFGVQ